MYFFLKRNKNFSALSALICILEVSLIALTVIRLPLLFKLTKKNLFTKKYKAINFRKIVHSTFLEMLKDIPFILLTLLLILIAPWRIRMLTQCLFIQQKRLPYNEERPKKINFSGKRKEILFIFWEILVYDYLNIAMGIILIVSGIKTKKTIEIIKKCYLKLKNDFHFSDFDERKDLSQELINLYEDLKTIIYLFFIIIIGFRVKTCYKRYFIFSNKEIN